MKYIYQALLLVLIANSSAGSEQRATTEQFYKSILSISDSQCKDRGELSESYKREGKFSEAESARIAEWSICECIPSKIKVELSSQKIIKNNSHISEEDFANIFKSNVLEKCSVEQMRKMYSAESCQIINSKFANNPNKFCSCMNEGIAKLSDNEMEKIGDESAAYATIAANARRQGVSAPKPPASLAKFLSIQASCSVK